jgi:class 3 adenylate cyclase
VDVPDVSYARSGDIAVAFRVRDLGLNVRAGVHTGECERAGEKLSGLAVVVGARISALAGGMHELKGVPGEWRLYAVNSA